MVSKTDPTAKPRGIRDCSVCVVGGAGFLGSHLVNHLIDDRHCAVLVIDNLVAGRREFVHRKAEFVHADITESEEYLKKQFQLYQVEYVFNYAAYPYIPVSFERPLHVFNVNATGALKVINAAQEAGCKGVLQVSSAEIYGGPIGANALGGRAPLGDSRRISEEEFVVPHSSYGAAKAAIDAMAQVRWREAGTPCIALRQFNCVGERETHPYVVPEIISQLAGQKGAAVCTACYTVHNVNDPPCDRCGGSNIDPDYQATVWLGNNSFRDFLYAGDAVRMAVELLEKGQFGEVYNLGSESGIKIYDLAKELGQVMGFKEAVVGMDQARVRPWEIWHLQSDNRKIYSVIGARPKVSLTEALYRTVQYYQANGNRWCWEK